jgi:STE24 endopeptidase
VGALMAAEVRHGGGGQDRREAARTLAALRRRLFFVATAVGLIATWALWASGASIAAWSALVSMPYRIGLVIYVALTLVVLALIAAPIAFYRGHVVSHHFGLSTQSVGGWLMDWLKGTALGTALMTAAGVGFCLLLWTTPELWWLLAGLIWTALMIALTFLAPYVLLPLFFKPRPLDDPSLVAMIENLADRAGTSVAGVSRLDFSRRTNEANAAVIGFGRSRRVVLADTLLESFSPAEIEAVVAHELGHHVHRDVARLLIAQTVLTFVGLGLAALFGDRLMLTVSGLPLAAPETLPLVLLVSEIGGLLVMPFLNGWSRSIEAQADTFAFDLLGDGRPFAAAMRRLADQNLAEERPPRWAELLLYTHPPIFRRIARAEAAIHV